MVVAVVDSTVVVADSTVAVAATVVADTGKALSSTDLLKQEAAAGLDTLQPLSFD
jgi:hypothetical protein